MFEAAKPRMNALTHKSEHLQASGTNWKSDAAESYLEALILKQAEGTSSGCLHRPVTRRDVSFLRVRLRAIRTG